MAQYAKYVSFLLLMVLALHIEARESKFFTKVTRESSNSPTNNVNKISEPPLLAPTPAPAPAPAVAEPLKEYGYGLYGHESSEFPPTKTTTTTTTISDFENEIPTEALSSTKSYKEYNTGDAYNKNGYYNNNYYNNNGYSNYNNNNNGYTNNYNNNGYVTEKKGMSDTRFLENGKYFYKVKTENYNGNGYESVKENGNNERYYGNNNENTYEFDTMEEYERQQGYPESQEGYVP